MIKNLVKLGFYPPWLYNVTKQVEEVLDANSVDLLAI